MIRKQSSKPAHEDSHQHTCETSVSQSTGRKKLREEKVDRSRARKIMIDALKERKLLAPPTAPPLTLTSQGSVIECVHRKEGAILSDDESFSLPPSLPPPP
mmetsp:Transcript_31742/g.62859  ORF Transcript_31742/g.62859 Transcript_31742/m.62859 type:complete len:101 (+) Transcript_31742:1737-2039(+)